MIATWQRALFTHVLPLFIKGTKTYQKENYHGSEVEIKAPQKIYGQEERQVSYFSARYDLLPAQSPGI